MADFIKGKEYWLADGSACYLNAKTEDGSYVVELLMENMTYDGSEWIPGPMMIVNDIFHKAPIAKKSEELVTINNKITEAWARLRGIENDIRNKETERKALFTKLDPIPALRRLEDFIDGKVTHIVVTNRYDINVKTFQELFEYDSNGGYRNYQKDMRLKLLTLYGDSKGDLSWKTSQYSDGSGYTTDELRLFTSKEDAWEYALEVYNEFVAELLPSIEKHPGNAATLLKLSNKMGLKADPTVTAINEKNVLENYKQKVDQARQKLVVAEQVLKDIEAGVPVVNTEGKQKWGL